MTAPTAFHEYHGRNIGLFENNTVAYRKLGYADGIVFSRDPLLPGEIFLLEISHFEHGWMGNLKIGLTQEDPCSKFALPQFALPGLVNGGKSWIVPVSAAEVSIYEHASIDQLAPAIYEGNNQIHTTRGSIPLNHLLPACHRQINEQSGTAVDYHRPSCSHGPLSIHNLQPFVYPADVGSRIGVTYVTRDRRAEMYVIVNGEVYGPCTSDIPYKNGPIYAVADLYGTTKQVQIVQTYTVPSLKIACRNKILQQVSHFQVFRLPLPKLLIDFLYDNS
ncbi:neuralized-like protein 2 [Uloborus diversus]|uniref:neuralized-like protein 2 n=1 Tax=Uloborus diversus TaxID=327109 RepID=UPI00240A82C6|nr:neuralized-like protein 2 [Uloborus diversus]XP_054708714.1 neuralized-like protein 2 [Uloborus diversus]XP_054708716.1 neuralized-like protein 2 [Uloborus diversus]XP_054708717.1 neuralized-like protein 2 [Uloborus diversus]